MLKDQKHNNIDLHRKSDILLTLSSLSSDEVFTPPFVVNSMLDLLPDSIWKDENEYIS